MNAGHNAPYLLRAGAASMDVEELSTGGTIIGMFPQALYEEGTIDMRPGDVLIVFTDGVTEALNPSDEEFGEERLKDLLRATWAAEKATLFGCRPEHLAGASGLLSEECKIQWGAHPTGESG